MQACTVSTDIAEVSNSRKVRTIWRITWRQQSTIYTRAIMQGKLSNRTVEGRTLSSQLPVRRQGKIVVRAASGAVRTDVRTVEGLEKVLQTKDYKAVLMDQFGCLHDGKNPYKGAVEAVRTLHARGVPIWIISNSSRRSGGTIDKLAKMGFPANSFAGAVTSGELAYQHLQNRPTDWWRTLGRRVLHLTWGPRGTVSLEGLNLEVVDWPEEAEFILAHGSEAVGSQWGRPLREMSLPKINQLLIRCAALSKLSQRKPIPMVVANPDLVTVDGDKLVVMPGTLAATYQELGGVCQIMGKPAPVIYEASLEGLGITEHPDQVLAIGDSVQHDIFGAASVGIDTLLVAGGIHAAELLPQGQQQIDMAVLQQLCEKHRASPTYVARSLVW